MGRTQVSFLILLLSAGPLASAESIRADEVLGTMADLNDPLIQKDTANCSLQAVAVGDSIVSSEPDTLAERRDLSLDVFRLNPDSFSQSLHLQTGTNFELPFRTNKPFEEVSWMGVPLFFAGILLKGEKKTFQQNYDNLHVQARLVPQFETKLDDYLQYFNPLLAIGLKVGGVEGRSDWIRFLSSASMTYGITGLLVNGLKYTTREQRPDGSGHNSWPSGHTATAFAGATILHKEYGLTRSPLYSVAGYGLATATGVMRVLNNRHWVSDIFSGAGIGIMSGELGYMLSDIIFKDRRLVREEMSDYRDMHNRPSFYSLSMGIGFGSHTLDFKNALALPDEASDIRLDFQMSTVVGAEGAYFLNKYVGVGGRLRVGTMPIKGWNDFVNVGHEETRQQLSKMLGLGGNSAFDVSLQDLVTFKEYSIVSDYLAEFSLDGGLYFHIPLSKRFAIGTKALIGGSTMQSLDISAHYKGNRKTLDYDMMVSNNKITNLSIRGLSTKTDEEGKAVTYDREWDFFTLKGSQSTKYGTGVSLTYSYKHNFSMRIFMDYDYTRKTFTLTYDAYNFMRDAMPDVYGLGTMLNYDFGAKSYSQDYNMHRFVVGGSLCVTF